MMAAENQQAYLVLTVLPYLPSFDGREDAKRFVDRAVLTCGIDNSTTASMASMKFVEGYQDPIREGDFAQS